MNYAWIILLILMVGVIGSTLAIITSKAATLVVPISPNVIKGTFLIGRIAFGVIIFSSLLLGASYKLASGLDYIIWGVSIVFGYFVMRYTKINYEKHT